MSARFLQWESYYRDWIPGKKQGPCMGLYKCIYLRQGYRPGRLYSSYFQGWLAVGYTDKRKNQICLIYKEIQKGAVAKSYMINGLLLYGEIFAHFLKY
jgi:hypothetical protein